MNRSARRTLRKGRGQVLVLACLTLFTMAAMLMTSFALTNAIHEKIRIQSHADAAAYSVATIEARSLNVLAYQNRAIATMMVSMMAVHGWMTIASMTVSILTAGIVSMVEIIGLEVAMGCYPYNISHCPCVIAAVKALVKYVKGRNQYQNKVKGKESDFNDVIEAYNYALIAAYVDEVAVAGLTEKEISPASSALSALKNVNAKNSSYATAVLAANVGEYACALENTPLDSLCMKINGNSHGVESMDDLSKVMANVANAARPQWERDGCSVACFGSASMKFMPAISDYLQNDIQGGNGTTLFEYGIDMSTGEEFNKNAPKGDKSVAIGAGAGTGVFTILGFKHSVGAFVVSSKTFSSSSGGSHSPAHSSNHNKFEGMAKESGVGKANFINFRGDYPNTYAAVTQDLGLSITGDRVKTGGNSHGWEVNDQARMKVPLGKAGTIEVPLKPPNSGAAVAKGVVYFHQPGNWRIQGTLFDPYWHGKLHFFDREEFVKILALSGDMSGAGMGAVAPVEGVD